MGFTTLKSYGSQFSITNKITPVVKTISATPAPATQTAYQKLLVDKKPWGRYGAEAWNQNTNTLPELGGTSSRDATTSGVMTCMTTGNGSTANIACIGGLTTSNISFPTGSLPPTYVIFSITRYNTGTHGRLLTNYQGNSDWLHGHFNNMRGVAYHGAGFGWITPEVNVGNIQDWLSMGATNSGIAAPNNVYVDNKPVGVRTDTIVNGGRLIINLRESPSDFEFSQLIIFDQALTVAEMEIVSNAFQNYLDTGVLDSPPYLSPYQKLLKAKKPWGRYSADSLNGNTLLESGGNTSRDAVISDLTSGNASGNGAVSPIAYLNGIQSSSSSITWIPGSIVAGLTMCSITRYTDGNGNIILGDKSQGSSIHGHYNKLRGILFINQFNSPQSSVGNLTDWLVLVSTINPVAIPNNVLIDGVSSATSSGGSIPSNQLVINNLNFPAQSAFQFSQLLIFDTVLTAAEMVIVSDALRNYLRTGVLD